MKKRETVAKIRALVGGGQSDPVLDASYRKKSVAYLGHDPNFTATVHAGVAAKAALDRAAAAYSDAQDKLREYATRYRALYNSRFHANVSTVGVPYRVALPEGSNPDGPDTEERYCSVSFSTRHNVHDEATLLQLEKAMDPDLFSKLFDKSVTETLKPGAADLIRGLMLDAGMGDDEIAKAMDAMLETQVSVVPRREYADEISDVPKEVRDALRQCVQRVKPSVKFP